MTTFCEDADYEWFLTVFKWAMRRYAVSVHNYVVMNNHYHATVTPGDALTLPRAMKELGVRYVQYFNKKYDRVGTLWTGRYRGICIEDERYWLTCLRYIEQNPVRAGIVEAAEEYRWSSYRVHAFGERQDWLTPHPVYLALGRTPQERQLAYRALCDAHLADDELALQRFQAAGAA